MCMYDDCDDMVTLLTQRTHKARKEHKCRECGRIIAPGEIYHEDRFVFEGRLTVHKACAHCLVVRDWLQAECGGWVYTGLREDLREHAADQHYGFGVRRLYVGMRNKWRRPSGRLAAITPRPPTTKELMQRTAP